MSILIVVAHPDDEVLGAGGAIATWSAKGKPVHCCILSGNVTARKGKPCAHEFRQDIENAHRILGIKTCRLGDFENIKFNITPHLSMVQFIEASILETQAELVLTHHPHDLNDDHKHTALACQAACRYAQRGAAIPPLLGLLYMEIPSATDWGFPPDGCDFQPNTFVEIGSEGLAKKVEAAKAYRGVLREYPHSRSVENLEAWAVMRGGQAGLNKAEAFQVAYQNLGRLF